MNKFFSLFCAVLFCANLSAQTLNESFEGEDFPPEGWTTYASLASASWKKSTKFGQVCAMVQGTYQTENWLITPQLKPASGESLKFSACIGEYASKGELRVEVSLSGTDKESFELVETYYTSSLVETNGLWKSEWKEYTVDMSKYQGQRIYVAFHQIYEADRIYLDDVKGLSIAGSSTCENPTNLVVSNITSESATISWQGEAAEYEYTYVLKGEEPNWASAIRIAAKTVTLSDLYEETAYDFYVRSVCADEVSLAPKVAFKTSCQTNLIPWGETFTRHKTGEVQPSCWTVASANPQVWVVADKTYDDEGEAQTVFGQAHLYAAGGGPSTEQVFALPTFDAQLNTLEIAFDYKTSMVNDAYGVAEIGYMTNPSKASTFISLQTLPQTLTYVRKTITLEDLPANAQYIAFRFAGGTSDFSGLSMDNFVVAEIGKSGEYTPTDPELDPAIWGVTYCEAQFTWYSYTAEAFAIGLFDVNTQALVAGIVATTGECDRFAYMDGIGFPEDDDYENHYYCSTKWILNVEEDGLQRGDAWNNCVTNVGTAASPILGLKEGKYQVQVYALVNTGSSYSKGDLLATIPFELVDKKVTNLKAEVAADKKTATLTWEQPALATGERLYVSVRAGETVAYDNFDNTKQVATSPLTFDVEDGKSYTATIQIINKEHDPLGAEVTYDFTVGVNPYEPTNAHAEIFSGDNVTFSWDVTTKADFYDIVLYWEGAYYTTLSVYNTTKTTTMPKDGTWSWTVQAFTQGTTGKYFPASHVIAGNDFESKAADIPEDAVVWNIWGFDAAYLDEASGYYQEGKYGWYITFATGDEDGTGYPMPSFLLYTAKENAISGVYNVARGNIDLESCYVNTTGRQEDAIWATDAEVRLQFDGYDEEKAEYGYRYGYYTGQIRLVGNDGKTYVGKFMELFCNSYNFSSMSTGILDHKGMWDEDPDYIPYQGIDEISTKEENALKMLRDGQLIIIRNGHEYNAAGMLIR